MSPRYIDDIVITLEECFDKGLACYALVDTAGESTLLKEKIFDYAELSFFPLYAGTDFENLIIISPLLVELKPHHEFTDWLTEEALEAHPGLGVCLASKVPTKEVLVHLQGLLEVKMPNFNWGAFRYYDARVIHRFAYGVDDISRERLLGPLEMVAWPYFWRKDPSWLWFAMTNTPKTPTQTERQQEPLEITGKDLNVFEEIQLLELAMRLESMFPQAPFGAPTV